MLVYRIAHKNYSKHLIASGLTGRWNRAGNKVIYCAESIALALLENMVRRQGVGFNKDFKTMVVEIPGNVKISKIAAEDLEESWRDFKDYSTCQSVGNDWYNKGKTAVLQVPSAVLPESFNYVINAEYKDYKKIQLIEIADLIPDKRLDDILKKYPKK